MVSIKIDKEQMKRIIEKTVLVIVFVTFMVASLILGKYHEFWADEAQSYLIARDTSFFELFQVIRYEGTPALWNIILKIVIAFGLEYQYFWIVPMFFSITGVFLLLFKTDLPLIVKILFPFTYYVFYQFNVVLRSYCLILPVLVLLSTVYHNKLEKNYLFSLYLILLLSISSHTFFMAGFIFLIYLIEFFRNFHQLDKNAKRKNIISICMIFLAFLITLIYVFPTSNISFVGNKGKNPIVAIANAFFSKNMAFNWPDTILTIIFIILICIKYEWKKYHLLILVMLAPIIMISFFHTELWHFGIILLAFLFICIVTNRLKTDYVLLFVFCVICMIQIHWATETWRLDYQFCCSPNEELVAELKENNYENKVVYGVDYNAIEVNPYFEKNIYDNLKTDKGYFWWSKTNHYMTEEEMIENPADIYIMFMHGPKDTEDIWLFLNNGEFERKDYFGIVFAKGEPYVRNFMSIFIKK